MFMHALMSIHTCAKEMVVGNSKYKSQKLGWSEDDEEGSIMN